MKTYLYIFLIFGFFTAISQEDKYNIRNFKGINSPGMEFSPNFYNKEGIFFCKEKKEGSSGQKRVNIYKVPKVDFSNLEIAESEDFFTYTEPDYFLHEGPLTFYDLSTIFFTRNRPEAFFNKGDKVASKNFALCESKFKNGQWSKPKELLFLDDGSVGHPAMSHDKKFLVLTVKLHNKPKSSKKKSTQYVGMADLFVSHIQDDGQLSEWYNLGKKVNTVADEMFPYISDDNTLYYSSNKDGSFDIFSVELGYDDENKVIVKGTPKKMPSPINLDNSDDLGFITNDRGKTGYFTSNRPGGMGGDDIYAFDNISFKEKLVAFKNEPEEVAETIEPEEVAETIEPEEIVEKEPVVVPVVVPTKVADAVEKEPVVVPVVVPTKVADAVEKEPVVVPVVVPTKVADAVEKEPVVVPVVVPTKVADAVEKEPVVVPVVVPTKVADAVEKEPVVVPVVVPTKVADAVEKEPVVVPVVVPTKVADAVEKEPVVVPAEVPTDVAITSDGILLDNSELSDDHEIDENSILMLKLKDQSEYEILKKNYLDTKFTLNKHNDYDNEILFESVFYALDRDDISVSERHKLNNVITVMEREPNLKLDIEAYADAYGSIIYNIQLTQNRAAKLKDYIVAHSKIDPDRIGAKGMGRSKLVNNCHNPKDCTPEQNGLNRRSQFVFYID